MRRIKLHSIDGGNIDQSKKLHLRATIFSSMRDIAADILYVRVWISRIFDQPLLQHLKLGLVVPIDAARKNSDNLCDFDDF